MENILSKYHIPYTVPKLLLPLKGLLKEILKRSSSLLSKVSFHSFKVHKMLLSDGEKAPCRGLVFSTVPTLLHHPEVFPYARVSCCAHEQDLFPDLQSFQESLPRLPSVLPSVHQVPRPLRILYVFP